MERRPFISDKSELIFASLLPFPFLASSKSLFNFTIVLKLHDGDKLISAVQTDGSSEIILVTRRGKALRFAEDSV
ncbi:MAG: hypothetical protein IIX43_06540, partial [Bacteroidales bacterium]|nr:hypothetical protein [Bacteroidales bacterium]